MCTIILTQLTVQRNLFNQPRLANDVSGVDIGDYGEIQLFVYITATHHGHFYKTY